MKQDVIIDEAEEIDIDEVLATLGRKLKISVR